MGLHGREGLGYRLAHTATNRGGKRRGCRGQQGREQNRSIHDFGKSEHLPYSDRRIPVFNASKRVAADPASSGCFLLREAGSDAEITKVQPQLLQYGVRVACEDGSCWHS